MGDQHHLFVHFYKRAVSRYIKYRNRLNRAIRSGRFNKYHRDTKSKLIHRLRRLELKINSWQLKLKSAIAAGAISLTLIAVEPIHAQSNLGPFVAQKRSANLLRAPFASRAFVSPVTVDIDNDGDFDVVAGSVYASNTEVYLFKNNGTPTSPRFDWQQGPWIPTTGEGNPFSGIPFNTGDAVVPAFADLDSDGDQDLLLGTKSNGFRYFRQNTDGSFTEQSGTWDPATGTGNPLENFETSWAVSNGTSNLAPTFADFDSDGDLDLVFGHDYDSFSVNATQIHVIVNEANRFPGPILTSSSPFDSQITGGPNSYRAKPRLIDVDADSDLDVFLGTSNDLVRFFKNNAGSYVDQSTDGPWDPAAGSGNPIEVGQVVETAVDFADMDNDGDADAIVFGNHDEYDYSYIRYYRNNGDFVFTELEGSENPFNGVPAAVEDGSNYNIYPAFVDYDLDGHADVLISSLFNPFAGADVPSLTLYNNNQTKDNLVEFTALTPSGASGHFPVEVNYDGAGGTDLVLANGNGVISLYVNNGNGNFTLANSNDLNTKVNATSQVYPAFVDWDNDGDPDAFVARGTGIEYFQNDGALPSPGFTQLTGAANPMDSFSFTAGSTLTSADANNDGHTDLFVSSSNGIVRFFVNQGSGSFVEYTASDRPLNGSSSTTLGVRPAPKLIDIDRDGDKDIFVGNESIAFPRSGIQFYKNMNRAPIVVPGGSTYTYAAGGPAITISTSLDLNDNNDGAPSAQDGNIAHAKIQITGNYVSGQDVLTFTPVGSISGAFDATTGTLNLVGFDTMSNYETALRSVKYANSSSTPSTSVRTITWYVFDHDATDPRLDATTDATVQVNVMIPNSAPVLSSSASSITFAGTPVALGNSVTLTDPDDTIASATVQLGSGYVPAEDVLLFTNQNGIASSFDITTGTLSLTGNATVAHYQTALRSIQYNNTGTNRSNANRTISISVNDGSLTSNSITVTLLVPNQTPTISVTTTSVSYTNADLLIDQTLIITDGDDSEIMSATVSFSAGYVSGEDVLVFSNQNGITGNYDAATGVLSLTGLSSKANYEAALRSVRYRNTTSNRTHTDRTIAYTVNDGAANSNAATIQVLVPNFAPTLTLSITSASYTGTDLLVDANLTIADTDDVNLQSATVRIQNGFQSGEDELVFSNQSGITGAFNTGTGVLSLTGSSSISNYQTALRSIAYRNNGANRTAAFRDISFQVNDEQTASAAPLVAVSVPNATPTLAAATVTAFYLSGDLIVSNSIAIADTDNTQLHSAAVTIGGGRIDSEDQLVVASTAGITSSYSTSTGVLTLNGVAPVSAYQSVLRSVAYRNTASNPNTASRTITFAVSDGTNTSNSIAITVGINSAPVVSAASQQTGAGGNVTLNVSDILSDPDNNLDLTTLQITSAEGASITITNGRIVVDYSSVADFLGTDVVTIRVCDAGGQCNAETVAIEVTSQIVVYNGVSPNGDNANDFLKIRFLPSGSRVSVYNRWGDLVFDMPDYDINDQNKRFEGLSAAGNELPSGTYFYKVETPQGKTVTGYLTLKR